MAHLQQFCIDPWGMVPIIPKQLPLFDFPNQPRTLRRTILEVISACVPPGDLRDRLEGLARVVREPADDLSDDCAEPATEREILLNAIGYCDWRAGSSWRKLHRPNHRWNATRWLFIDAGKFFRAVLEGKEARQIGAAVDTMPPKKPVIPARLPIPLKTAKTGAGR